MSLAAKYNNNKGKGTFMGETPFTVDTKDFRFIQLAKLFEENENDTSRVYPLRGMYINTRSKFHEEEPIFVTDGYFVGLPQHMLDSVKDILEDEESIQQINEGKAGFKVRTYTSKRAQNINAVFLSVEFVDL